MSCENVRRFVGFDTNPLFGKTRARNARARNDPTSSQTNCGSAVRNRWSRRRSQSRRPTIQNPASDVARASRELCMGRLHEPKRRRGLLRRNSVTMAATLAASGIAKVAAIGTEDRGAPDGARDSRGIRSPPNSSPRERCDGPSRALPNRTIAFSFTARKRCATCSRARYAMRGRLVDAVAAYKTVHVSESESRIARGDDGCVDVHEREHGRIVRGERAGCGRSRAR